MLDKIDGVSTKKLVVHPDNRGRLFEILRCDDAIFNRFGQVYLTTAYPGIIKAWHYHKVQTDYFCCIQGKARLVLYDARQGSATMGNILEFIIGPENLMLVTIPPEVYHGFQCVSEIEALMINIPTEPYNPEKPDEYRIDEYSADIPYTWPKKD
ncbi:MAG TPA: dTDP-4-dehydrorhamnose 3,5-epimerase [candidate division Zixibacteria bacterium]|nr:dTDP-4-dehydrorhamnose 3,5-epimerase [candidate division Zixibacteria bacterium]